MAAVKSGLILVLALLVATIVRLIFFPLLMRLARRSQAGVDDSLVRALRNPTTYSLVLVGVTFAVEPLTLPANVGFVLSGLVKSLVAIIWGTAAWRVGTIFLEAMSRNQDRLDWIQPKTVPVLRIGLQVMVIAATLYFLLVAWHINATSWLASAGVLGIAIGFAAKDTLANLFAGVFILADAPYKIGDFVDLESGLRGRVTDIGVRSSRIRTRDDIEITVPNAMIANSRIVNETGGRHQKMRVRVKVSVAYGSDPDQVREILLSCTESTEHLCENPAPRVRLRELGDSGLHYELLAWIREPVFRGRVLDELNTRVYKALNAAGIEIPYPKQDVYLRQIPPVDSNPRTSTSPPS
jgi:small-conductance mechanosensitive channel